jgi:putative tricarboxylic transport membrane protein
MPLLLAMPEGTRGRRRRCAWALAACVPLAFAVGLRGDEPLDRLTIVAPAAPGGGWDLTAHAMADVLQGAGIVRRVDVVNSPGAGGSIALAEFINAHRGDPHILLVGGLVMISAIRANHATESILETTPLARLEAEAEVVVVRSDSQMTSLADVLAVMRSQPGALVWTGGSYGGTDQLLLRNIAEAVGLDTTSINYVPNAGGGEGLRSLLSGRSTAAVGNYSEFAPGIRSGRLKALAMSSDSRMRGLPIRTLKEQGVNVTMSNWRGVFAPPGLAPEEIERLSTALDRMVHDPRWHRILAERFWTDAYLAGDAYTRFVESEQHRIDTYFTQAAANDHPSGPVPAARWKGNAAMGAIVIAVLVLPGLVLWSARARRSTREREVALSRELKDALQVAESERGKTRDLLGGLSGEIDRQFTSWGLTAAEREIGILMLKGLRHKEIALARNTTERTVRQQALAVYKKAGLDGRSDLAAYFLEDFLPPRASADQPTKAAS